MKIKELAKKCKWKDVKRHLVFIYPEQRQNIKRYKEIFEEVKNAKDIKVDKKEYIDIKRCFDIYDNEITEWYGIATNKYSLSFRKWEDLANLKVRQNNLLNAEIMAYFLWEITYSSFDEKTIKK